MARTTRAMAIATKRVMATDSETMGNGYCCPLSSVAVAAAAVGKDNKCGSGLFLYGVVVK
jgi:hypothetical protein